MCFYIYIRSWKHVSVFFIMYCVDLVLFVFFVCVCESDCVYLFMFVVVFESSCVFVYVCVLCSCVSVCIFVLSLSSES